VYGVACTGQPLGFTRKHFAVVALDGPFRVPAVAPLLQRLIKLRSKDARGSDLGIGIDSMMGFTDTSKLLQVTYASPTPGLV
jgi:hypothetical protein